MADTNDTIRVFAPDAPEHKILRDFAAALTAASGRVTYTVKDTYFDYGQNWKWTTIVAEAATERPDGMLTETWQALSPAEHRKILHGTDSDRESVTASIMTMESSILKPGKE